MTAPAPLLVDNWTLQNAGELLHQRLLHEPASEMTFAADNHSFQYADVAQEFVAFECLCQVLQNVVFAPRLLVEQTLTSCWEDLPSIVQLKRAGLVLGKPFKETEDKWIPIRERLEEDLCFCPPVRQRHQQTKAQYQGGHSYGVGADKYLAQVLWGGAGMMARAAYLRIPYSPHPLRERLFSRARLFYGASHAAEQVRLFVAGQRCNLFQRIDGSGFVGRVHLPPVVVEILDAASSLDEVVPAALAIRDKYTDLRNWIGEFQSALDGEDTKEILSRRRLLESVARNVDALSGGATEAASKSSVKIGLGWVEVGADISSPLQALRCRFGVRAIISGLIISASGQNSVKKFVGWLTKGNTEDSIRLERTLLGPR